MGNSNSAQTKDGSNSNSNINGATTPVSPTFPVPPSPPAFSSSPSQPIPASSSSRSQHHYAKSIPAKKAYGFDDTNESPFVGSPLSLSDQFPSSVPKTLLSSLKGDSRRQSLESQDELDMEGVPTSNQFRTVSSSSSPKNNSVVKGGNEKETTTPTIVKWTKGGKQVYVTGSFNSWKSKIPMLKSPSSNEHSVTLYLPAGTHRFKFIVDGEWRCSTDLPTAQDNDGVMVNYVEVMTSRTPSSSFKEPSKLSSSVSPYSNSPNLSSSPTSNTHLSDPISPSVPSSSPRPSSTVSKPKPIPKSDTASSSKTSTAYPDSPPGSYSSSIPHFLRHPHLSSSPPIAPASFVSSASSSPDTTIPPLLPPQLTKVLLNSNNTSKDDPTILPMPNHVVLNHLYACSIRDGVMAVASTMRYRKKYVTTVLYKPVNI